MTAGDLELRIPKLRPGSFFPSLPERRRRADQALFAVIMEAHLHGVSTRRVDDLVKALGADSGISKSEVSRISDAHIGLKQAINAVLLGAAWQRCRVHFLRNVLAQVPKGNAEMVAAAVRTIFAQPDAEYVREQRGNQAARGR